MRFRIRNKICIFRNYLTRVVFVTPLYMNAVSVGTLHSYFKELLFCETLPQGERLRVGNKKK